MWTDNYVSHLPSLISHNIMNKIAIIGGTGLSQIPELEIRERKTVTTRYGEPSSSLICGRLNGVEVIFLARHGPEHTIAPHSVNYRANISALDAEGVNSIIAVNAVGGIRADMQPGTLVLPEQIIDYTYGREHSFCGEDGTELQHVDFTHPYSEHLRQLLLTALNGMEGNFVCGGVHGVTQGPRLETAAEIDRLERDGCDIVGMTGMPEAALARELGMDYACLALVVNPAAGRCREAITMADIQKVLDAAIPRVKATIAVACEQLCGEMSND